MSRISTFPRQSRPSLAVRGALAVIVLGAAASVWAVGAGETAAAAEPAAPLAITVRPGQSLNDIAFAVTQSRDPVVLARVGRALFDANPQAFMKHDPSRLRLGATLTVPPIAASGAVHAQHAAAGTTAALGGAASAAHAGSSVHPASAASTSASVSTSVPAAHASSASDANAAMTAGASAQAGASAANGNQPASPSTGASGPHVWSGAIQPGPASASDAVAPSMPGSMTAVEPSAAVGAHAAPARPASQPRPSSLQQLLALKNRVLMELQKHGIGKPAATDRTAADIGSAQTATLSRPAANEAGASASAATATSDIASAVQPTTAPARPAAPATEPSWPVDVARIDWRAASAIGAALVALLAGFVWRKRRNARRAGDEFSVERDVTAAADNGEAGRPASQAPLPQPEKPLARDTAAGVHATVAGAAAAMATAAAAAGADESERSGAPEPVADAPSRADVVADAKSDESVMPAEVAQQNVYLQNAIVALDSLDLPLPPRTSLGSSATQHASPESAGLLSGDKKATNGQVTSHPPVAGGETPAMYSAEQENDLIEDVETSPLAGQNAAAATEFVRPPLGAAQFGALKLDFDLDLPAAPSAVLPAFTPDELARIARNKLDLAGEYIELGDLSGARTLLQEVVESNDAATRDDARALLTKLADES